MIAQEQDKPAGTVRSHHCRALRRLAQKLRSTFCPDDEDADNSSEAADATTPDAQSEVKP
jgi:hypothetical protein